MSQIIEKACTISILPSSKRAPGQCKTFKMIPAGINIKLDRNNISGYLKSENIGGLFNLTLLPFFIPGPKRWRANNKKPKSGAPEQAGPCFNFRVKS